MGISRKEFDAAIRLNFGEDAMGYKKAAKDEKDKGGSGDTAFVKETRNEVYISGKIFGVWIRENSAFALIDVGMKQNIPCSLYGDADADLADQLDRFSKGDPIQIVGYVNPWSSKKDGAWVNHCDIRITEIRGTIPAQKSSRQVPPSWESNDPGY